MSIRDSRVISSFINAEFSFLTHEMDDEPNSKSDQSVIDQFQQPKTEKLSCSSNGDLSGHQGVDDNNLSIVKEDPQLCDNGSSDRPSSDNGTTFPSDNESVSYGSVATPSLSYSETKLGKSDCPEENTAIRVCSVDSGVELSSNNDNLLPSSQIITTDSDDVAVCIRPNPMSAISPDIEDDEDKGVYDASSRASTWMFVKEDESEDESTEIFSRTGSGASTNSVSEDQTNQTNQAQLETMQGQISVVQKEVEVVQEEVTVDQHQAANKQGQAEVVQGQVEVEQDQSEKERCKYTKFVRAYRELSFKTIQRQSSVQTFSCVNTSEVSAEKEVSLDKSADGDGLGFHIIGNHPTQISKVIPGSKAEKGGLEIGDVIIAIDYDSVLDKSHSEIVDLLLQAKPETITLELCKESSLSIMTPGSQQGDSEIFSAYMYKLVNSTFNIWKKRWFVLKSDNCLYYYKSKEDKEILGAIPLSGYMIQKATDLKRSRDYSLKLMHRSKSYYFAAENEDDYTEWGHLLNNAVGTQSMDVQIAVTSHNVGVPALSIRKSDCNGFLFKMGGHHKSWKKRYCVLKDGCLFYYCDIDSRSAQGVAHLHGYTTIANLPSNKKNAFALSPPEPKMRTFHFYTETELDKERWIRAMKLSIGRWIQVK